MAVFYQLTSLGSQFGSIAQFDLACATRLAAGASVTGITSMLSKDFVKLVAIAMLIAAPLSGYFMQDWLNSFAFRIDFPWWYFIAAGATALVIAFLTVGFQGLKAALANPVESLRSE